MTEWAEIAMKRGTVVRGLKFAAVVGTALIAMDPRSTVLS